MRRTSALILVLLCGACNDQPRKGVAAPAMAKEEAKPAARETPADALTMRGSVLATRLGPHRLTCKASTSSEVPGYPARKLDQEMTWRMDADRAFHARKDTHKQYGQEVILSGGWLYARLRYSKFTRHRPREGEAAQVLDRMASYLPDYMDLLGRFLKIEPKGEAKAAGGRAASKVALSLRESPGAAMEEGAAGPARTWRSSVEVTELTGVALLDAESRAALSVDLKARLTFMAPRPGKKAPASGIPAVVSDKLKGTMTLSLTQRVDRLGKVKAVQPPAEEDTVTDVRRRRLELERQILAGERPLPGDWSKEP